jgi:hypothetical protein
MQVDVAKAQSATLTEWAELWRRLDAAHHQGAEDLADTFDRAAKQVLRVLSGVAETSPQNVEETMPRYLEDDQLRDG